MDWVSQQQSRCRKRRNVGLLGLGCMLFMSVTHADVPISFTSPYRSFASNVVKYRKDSRSKLRRSNLKLSANSIPDRLIDTLDLSILMEGISKYTGSRRGRQSFLQLVNGKFDDRQPKNGRADDLRAKLRRVSSTFRAPSRYSLENNDFQLNPVALSAEEARNEFQLVEQAMRCLQQADGLTYPDMIYGNDSSPWDTKKIAVTDYDEWLTFPSTEEWSLEHILEADQVIGTLLRLYEWANLATTVGLCPGLAEIGQRIQAAALKSVHAEVTGSVEISRVRTYCDPIGKSVRFIFLYYESNVKSMVFLTFFTDIHISAYRKEISIIAVTRTEGA